MLSQDPVPARPAASVLLIRDGHRGLEVFLQQRSAGMAFAPNVAAFPGGGLDDRDSRTPLTWCGPEPSWWAARFGCAVDVASALVCAAVRETFEECGVLLAGVSGDTLVDPLRHDLPRLRRRFVEDRIALTDLLSEQGWALRADMLRPWAHWITPEVRPRRYDTRFFLAELPGDQLADSSTPEVSNARWVRPGDVLADSRNGAIQLMLPTLSCLEDLAEFSDVRSALRAGANRSITTVMPVITIRDGVEVVTVP